MSFELPSQRKTLTARPAWSGAAVLVEAMLLLVFLVGSLAVFTQLFAASAEQAAQSRTTSEAVAAASNAAERFLADPQNTAGQSEENGLRVMCSVTREGHEGGILYRAEISVYDDAISPEEPVYAVSTARYESGVR